MKLETIQQEHKLNNVFTNGDIGPGGAYHGYSIMSNEAVPSKLGSIFFQKGPRHAEDSIPGVLDTDLLEIVRHRLQHFQAGDYACHENDMALRAIEEALLYMNERVKNRAARGVLGTVQR